MRRGVPIDHFCLVPSVPQQTNTFVVITPRMFGSEMRTTAAVKVSWPRAPVPPVVVYLRYTPAAIERPYHRFFAIRNGFSLSLQTNVDLNASMSPSEDYPVARTVRRCGHMSVAAVVISQYRLSTQNAHICQGSRTVVLHG